MYRRPIDAEKPSVARCAWMRCARPFLFLASATLSSGVGCTDPVFSPSEPDTGVTGPVPDAGPGEGAADASTDAGSGAETSCTTPSCREDGGTIKLEDAGPTDAGADLSPDASLDPVRDKWAGRYATRSNIFVFDDPLRSSSRLLTIAEIVPNQAGGLTLHEEHCLYEGGWSFFVAGQLRYVFVDAKSSSTVSYDADHFESEGTKVQLGYGPSPSTCRGASSAPKSEEQVWIAGANCECARNEDLPPSNRNDCRVTDQERDKFPGATFPAFIDTSVIAYRVAQEERTRLLNGYRRGDRLYAEREFIDTTYVLECTVNGQPQTTGYCATGQPRPCPSTYNKMELVEIEPSFTCAHVIAQEQGLFATPLVPFPAACPAELSATKR